MTPRWLVSIADLYACVSSREEQLVCVSEKKTERTILRSPAEKCSMQNRFLLLYSTGPRSAAMSIVLIRRELIYSDRLSLASFLSDWCTRLNLGVKHRPPFQVLLWSNLLIFLPLNRMLCPLYVLATSYFFIAFRSTVLSAARLHRVQ